MVGGAREGHFRVALYCGSWTRLRQFVCSPSSLFVVLDVSHPSRPGLFDFSYLSFLPSSRFSFYPPVKISVCIYLASTTVDDSFWRSLSDLVYKRNRGLNSGLCLNRRERERCFLHLVSLVRLYNPILFRTLHPVVALIFVTSVMIPRLLPQ